MANITRLARNLFTGGDLPSDPHQIVEHLDAWAAAGITHVIDPRRFVAGEPLYRVHECVFGVLALESEPVDPRL